jgi:hypothetical protein
MFEVGDKVRCEAGGHNSFFPRCNYLLSEGRVEHICEPPSDIYLEGEIEKVEFRDYITFYRIKFYLSYLANFSWSFAIIDEDLANRRYPPGWPTLIEEKLESAQCTCTMNELWYGCKCGAFQSEKNLWK